ncbi:TatD family hydrolase [Dysgonomonas sp. 520]|uniref:TatD family hydrolase n=1 Tax=Dysgonomonas sp. 520 TaxID=2302931 RepID=UPI0013D13B50|nr:TatD family hydrolase [Dysgonomonas sp. 520]NDW10005.1 hypothetical protein [Dysgonomonas sp. 520]
MNYYNIHTHNPFCQQEENGDYCNRIFNVYPLEFEVAKEDTSLSCCFSCGLHPWYSDNADSQLNYLQEVIANDRIIAIGEAGYDRLKGGDMQSQRHIFETQIQFSETIGKPLIIHCVKAWEELIDSHKKFNPKQPWIIHGYRGKPELTRQLLKYGFYFSIGEKFNSQSAREIPVDKLFCETDDKQIPVKLVYQKLGETLNMNLKELSEIVNKNVADIFPKLLF